LPTLAQLVYEQAAATGFSGVVRVDLDAETVLATAYGSANRAHALPVTLATQFGTASMTKGFTTLVVLRLIEDGALRLHTTARTLLGDDLPLVDDEVTVEHLLAHRSGIGDYLDEDTLGDITDYVMPVPVHLLASTQDYLVALDGHPQVSRPGEAFRYNNAGFVVLALLAERATGRAFADLVEDLVCAPAGLHDTTFLRSDELPGRAAVGYLSADSPRTNVLHLPVFGSGDGGLYSTASDLHGLWAALYAGRIITPPTLAEMTRPRSDWPEEDRRYGLGIHLYATTDAVFLEGMDAGVSCASHHDPRAGTTFTVLSNTSLGAWPLVSMLARQLSGRP
jgi:CubicO group peptidase (beta-lactamase class C family)